MNASISVPFLHTVFLTTAAIAAVVSFQVLPKTWLDRWFSVPIAGTIGLGLAGALHLFGLIPLWGTLTLAAFSLFMICGFTLAWWLLRQRAHHLGLNHSQVVDLIVVSLVLGVIGARARFVWERWDLFSMDSHGHPLPLGDTLGEIFDLNAGGAVWYGGVSFAVVGCLWLCQRWRLPPLALADLAMPPLLAGLATGRIGCFFNGCCFGAPCDLPWGIPSPRNPLIHVHPTQLYETVVCGLMAAGLWWFWARRRWDGQILILTMLGYGLWRFLNESLRHEATGDDPGANTLIFGLFPGTTSQATSLDLILGALVLGAWLAFRRRNPQHRTEVTRVPGSRHALPAISPGAVPAERIDS